jgi:RHS repeat-associated protein
MKQWTDYFPYGKPIASENYNPSAQPYKFGGKEQEAMFGLDLYDFHARQMDSRVGSFLTVDPLAEKYYSISPYAYCGNNPLRFVDPTGMEFVLRDDQIEGLEKLHEILDSSKPFKNDRFVFSKDEKNKPKKETETTSLPLVLATTGEIIGAFATAVVSTALLVLTFSGDTPLYKQADNYIPPPNSLDGFLDATKVKPKAKRARWHLPNGDIAEWDSQHGELEVYDKTGKNHRGAYDPKTGKKKKDGDPKRKTEPK